VSATGTALTSQLSAAGGAGFGGTLMTGSEGSQQPNTAGKTLLGA
jgi:hypothetical protein